MVWYGMYYSLYTYIYDVCMCCSCYYKIDIHFFSVAIVLRLFGVENLRRSRRAFKTFHTLHKFLFDAPVG